MSSSKPISGPHSDLCFTGVKHTGGAAGKTTELGGIATNVAELKSGEAKGIILYFSDVHGPFYINNQLIQDYYAENGFLVLGVDYFFGDPIHNHPEPDFDRETWIETARSRAAKYTTIGYCFGATYAVDLASTDEVVAAGFAHPGPLTEDQFRNVKKPFLILAAETDRTFPQESRSRAEAILTEIGATYHLRLFSGVSHGFAVRGDPEIENSRWAKEEAAATVVSFFSRFTKA
ncbi:Protein AIM2 [Leucoagaricus sp. SymC.cos]|nr:Protein AIM2 [Leucoagaricus sp. SymC.cos]